MTKRGTKSKGCHTTTVASGVIGFLRDFCADVGKKRRGINDCQGGICLAEVSVLHQVKQIIIAADDERGLRADRQIEKRFVIGIALILVDARHVPDAVPLVHEVVEEIQHAFVGQLFRERFPGIGAIQDLADFVERDGTDIEFNMAVINEGKTSSRRAIPTRRCLQQSRGIEYRRNHGFPCDERRSLRTAFNSLSSSACTSSSLMPLSSTAS